MSLIGTLGKILGTVVGVVKTVGRIGAAVLPFVRAAREISPDVDRICDTLEAQIDAGGEQLDDFLDRNLPTLEAMRGFAIEVQAWGASLQDMAETGIDVSQGAVSPETVDPAEAKRLALAIDIFRARSVDLATAANKDLEDGLKAFK
jgi:hypothetical protein